MNAADNMNISRRSLMLGSTAMLALGGCSVTQVTGTVSRPARQDLFGLPYHPLPYHLDLCILTYQLYAQSLVWPFDPYYEKLTGNYGRDAFMARVHDWAKKTGAEQTRNGAPFGGYRGPGALGGFADNPRHDPILYRYDQLRTTRRTLSSDSDRWQEQQTPNEITGKIDEVHVAYRRAAHPVGTVEIERVKSAGAGAAAGARDVLLAFEGDTGDKGEAGQPASQSLMGFVLLRYMPDGNDFDIHIVFRGSRSGSAERAANRALSTKDASGNPDWITDLGYDFVSPSTGGGHISTQGRVHRGFARSIQSIAPQLFACLSQASTIAKGRHPKRIYVTGHSLGAGLAHHFVSSVLLGNQYGPTGTGNAMPSALRSWPWKAIKLLTFSAPVSGDEKWARALTIDALGSKFFAKAALGTVQTDPKALAVSDPTIVPRLVDPETPAAFRVLNSIDPITTLRVLGGKHVGQTVYVDQVSRFGLVDPSVHEPAEVRRLILKTLADPSIPPTGWWYHELAEFAPQYGNAAKASPEALDSMVAAMVAYYAKNGGGFDAERFRAEAAIFKSMMI